ncbi:MAG: DUF1574 family protein [Chitinophagaceae bacterium]|jgi:hypothetical protein|nr:DUF1574 family protein [Chitinophagaceae bacterium]MCW5905021.1 DUF1574 family protein [Chitinophagaceae bacterium]
MKKFILKIILFSLPVWAMIFSIEISLRNIPNDYSYKKKYLDKHAAEIETLIFGSSHSFRGINPAFFSGKAFNASHVSQSLNYDYEIFKKYQDKFEKLKTIVLLISYSSLYGKLETGVESWRVKNYVIYYGINTPKSITDYSEFLSNKLNINKKRLVAYYKLHESNITCTTLGWGGMGRKSGNEKDLIETGKTAAKRHTKNIHSEKYQTIFNNNVSILHSIIKWSQARNIKILFFTPPAFHTYREHINIEQLNTTIETINTIVSNNNNCMYINFFDDPNFIAKDFYDADHLSETGAEKLSKLINYKIDEWK